MKFMVSMGLFVLILPSLLFADYIDYKKTKVIAVQRKAYKLKHELTLTPVYLPFDPYTTGVGIGFSYTYNFSDSIAWTFIDGNIVTSFETSLRAGLVKDYDADTKDFKEIKYIFSTGLRYTPFYYKGVFFNSMMLHGHGYFVLGISMLKVNKTTSTAVSESSFKYGNYVGFGFNLLTKNDIILSITFKDHLYWDDKSVSQIMALYLGFGINFGTGE